MSARPPLLSHPPGASRVSASARVTHASTPACFARQHRARGRFVRGEASEAEVSTLARAFDSRALPDRYVRDRGLWEARAVAKIQRRWRARQNARFFRRYTGFVVRWRNGCGGTIPARFHLHIMCWRRALAQRALVGFLRTYARDCARAAMLALRFYERIRKVRDERNGAGKAQSGGAPGFARGGGSSPLGEG